MKPAFRIRMEFAIRHQVCLLFRAERDAYTYRQLYAQALKNGARERADGNDRIKYSNKRIYTGAGHVDK